MDLGSQEIECEKVVTNNFQVSEGKSVSIEQSPGTLKACIEEASRVLETTSIGGKNGQKLVRKDGTWALRRSEDGDKTERIQTQVGSECSASESLSYGLRNSVQMAAFLPQLLHLKKRTIYHLHHEVALRSKTLIAQHMAQCLKHTKCIISGFAVICFEEKGR